MYPFMAKAGSITVVAFCCGSCSYSLVDFLGFSLRKLLPCYSIGSVALWDSVVVARGLAALQVLGSLSGPGTETVLPALVQSLSH